MGRSESGKIHYYFFKKDIPNQSLNLFYCKGRLGLRRPRPRLAGKVGGHRGLMRLAIQDLLLGKTTFSRFNWSVVLLRALSRVSFIALGVSFYVRQKILPDKGASRRSCLADLASNCLFFGRQDVCFWAGGLCHVRRTSCSFLRQSYFVQDYAHNLFLHFRKVSNIFSPAVKC